MNRMTNTEGSEFLGKLGNISTLLSGYSEKTDCVQRFFQFSLELPRL